MTLVETVSDSEIGQVTRCQMAHFFGYGMSITPKVASSYLQVGLVFHEMMAAYYQNLKDGENWDDACDAGYLAGTMALMENRYFAEYVETATRMFEEYVQKSDGLEWEVVAVEEAIEYLLDDEVALIGVVDLVVRIKRASKEILKKYPDIVGKLAIVDHKSCYNFWTKKERMMHVQLPKYIFAANRTKQFGDELIEYGIIHMVRTRSDAKQLFERDVIKPSLQRQVNIVNDHIKAAKRLIIPLRKLPLPLWEMNAVRTTNKDICKNCDFINLCDRKLEGVSTYEIIAEIRTYFKKRDLKYREERKMRALKRELEENGS